MVKVICVECDLANIDIHANWHIIYTILLNIYNLNKFIYIYINETKRSESEDVKPTIKYKYFMW